MIPGDGPLGLPHSALRGWAIALLCLCAAGSLAIAFATPGQRITQPPRRRVPAWLSVLCVALLVRALASLAVDGQIFDVLVAYRSVGDGLFHGADIWSGATEKLATYPPTIYVWWAISALVPAAHPHLFAALVRAPFWTADAGIAVLLLRLVGGDRGRRAAWVYALCPVAIAVPALHGQADPIVDLLFVIGVALVLRGQVRGGALATGLAIAVKQWPVFFLPALLAFMPRRQSVRFVVIAAAPAVLAFAAYGAVHPYDAVHGFISVATYRPHRTGLGTSLIFPLDSGYITAINLAVAVGGAGVAVAMVRRGRSLYDAIAFDMLCFVALSPTVYDQYLMWALPFLLLAGRLRSTALLGVGLLPAVLSVNLWTSQNDGDTPDLLFVIATLSTLAVAASLLLRPSDRHSALRPLAAPLAAAL